IVMKSKHMMEMLKMSNGKFTPIEMARRLKIHPANISKYISFMQKCGFIEMMPDGKLKRKQERFVVDI
ncbi:MAG: DUF4423 domain-containing protein, partial [Candidatus Aenigmatarchaeota archaeon]